MISLFLKYDLLPLAEKMVLTNELRWISKVQLLPSFHCLLPIFKPTYPEVSTIRSPNKMSRKIK